MAAGLEQVLEASAYRRLSVYRPLIAVGKQEIGYLPGDLDEKLAPWMAAVHDNLYALLRRDEGNGRAGGSERGARANGAREHRQIQSTIESLVDRGQLELAAITYLRGRSITDEFVVVDLPGGAEPLATTVTTDRYLYVLNSVDHAVSGVVNTLCCGKVDNPQLLNRRALAFLVPCLPDRPRIRPLAAGRPRSGASSYLASRRRRLSAKSRPRRACLHIDPGGSPGSRRRRLTGGWSRHEVAA